MGHHNKTEARDSGLRTRFAPSPTGYLHAGHAASALFSARRAQAHGGTFVLRIEDIDSTRCRPHFETAIYADLNWLGLEWETPVRRQSAHMDVYRDALETLRARDLLYPCFCTRKQIREETARAHGAPHGPEGPVYPGTCRRLSAREQRSRIEAGKPFALRLDMRAALACASGPLFWQDAVRGVQKAAPESFGDVILARKDMPASYHLCVTLDDHIQKIGVVTRGEDLFEATHIHRLLQHLLGLDVPLWHHHGLICDAAGKRLAKRDGAQTLRHLRDVQGLSPADLMPVLAPALETADGEGGAKDANGTAQGACAPA